ncbi:MAG: CrcB family protein [Actinomycetota bacterium]|nr:CrcB family protein [Actinomycetota bacterium]
MALIAMIAVAGAAGALCRAGVNTVVGPRSFPLATLAVNVVGSFALGVLVAWGSTRLSPEVLSALTVGFLGAFTTFSTFTFEALTLSNEGRTGVALTYVAVSLALGLTAAAVGHQVGRALLE